MPKLEISKEIVKDNFNFAYGGIFNTRNDTGDEMIKEIERWKDHPNKYIRNSLYFTSMMQKP